MGTKIEWVTNPDGTKGETWNFIGGCTKRSPGCDNCYALRDSWRIMNNPKHPARYDDVCGVGSNGVQWTGRVNLDYKALELPLRWRKPRTVFVCSMSDFFHPLVPLEFQIQAFKVMEQCHQHTFQILTKRAEQLSMMEYVCGFPRLPNVWVGVTTENQKWANERIPDLLTVNAPVHFVSVEPMLEPVVLTPWFAGYEEIDETSPSGKAQWRCRKCGDITPAPCKWPYHECVGLNQVIIGCESGPNRRPMKLEWAIDLVRQCKAANVPVFVKQLNVNSKVSKNPDEWPEELRVREYPQQRMVT